MALLFKLCIAVIVVSVTQASLTGADGGLGLVETCETSFGGSYREGESWTKCGTGATCCFHSCQCVRILGTLVESCQQACPGISLLPGCRIIEPFQNATHQNCCRTECAAKQQCTSDAGVQYDVGQTWDECVPEDICCQNECTCTRRGDTVEPLCFTLCSTMVVPEGCSVVRSALSPTNSQCCRLECPGPDTCTSSFGVDFREGDNWTECTTRADCCFESCDCVRQGGLLQRQCAQACPGISLLPGCRIIEPFQNATHHNCCRTECAVQQQCTSDAGVQYDVGQTWDECLPHNSCCQKGCTCTRRGDTVEPLCFTLCPKIAVPEGCSVVRSAVSPTNSQCCRLECPGPDTCTSSFGVEFREGDNWTECTTRPDCCFESCDCVRQRGLLQRQCAQACPGLRLEAGCQIIEPFQNATYRDCCRTQCS